MELELRFAQICDMAIGGQELGLISFVLESGKAKGQVGKGRDPPESWPMLRTKSQNTTTDQFPVQCDQDCPYPNGHSYLEILDANKNVFLMVTTSSESFIIQVGGSAGILYRESLAQPFIVCADRRSWKV
uniref:Uncharacterized protein n=1 Tax=Salix viminalis TaxID=40686 RepID=A0A6N2LFB0_SALVM